MLSGHCAVRIASAARRRPDIELDELIDELEEALAEGRRVPFSGRLIIDEERLLDIIDRMRVAVPEEIKQARRVVQEKERILGEAHATVREAMSEQGLLQAVEDERRGLLETAEQEAMLTRAGADDYARQVLEELASRLEKAQQSIRNGLESLDHA